MVFIPTRMDIRVWFDQGKKSGAYYMIIVYDSFSHEDYPSYVGPEDDVHERIMHHRRSPMQSIMEVYDLRQDRDDQLLEHRTFRCPPWPQKDPDDSTGRSDSN